MSPAAASATPGLPDALAGRSAKPALKADPRMHPFRAELDLTELDERGRPGPTWTGRGTDICRSGIAFKSRRMCYEGRELMVAVHLVDDHPVPLCGLVSKSDYDGDGLYRTELTLKELPDREAVRNWILAMQQRAA